MYQSFSSQTVFITLDGLQDGGGILSVNAMGDEVTPEFADFYLWLTQPTALPPDRSALDLFLLPCEKGGPLLADFPPYGPPPLSMYAGSFAVRSAQTAQKLLLPQVRVRPPFYRVAVVSRLGFVMPAGCQLSVVPFGVAA